MTMRGRFAVSSREMNPMSARGAARHVALSVLARTWSISGRTAAALKRPRVHFINLHHVFADEEAGLRALLHDLVRDHEFISYSEAVDRVREGKIDRPYVTFSLDDGFKNSLRAAAIFREFGARACFFVITSMVGESDFEKVARFCASTLHAPAVEFLTWADIDALRMCGHEIGGHSATHTRLSAIEPHELDLEIFGSAEVLRRRLGETGHFAWPYGQFRDMSVRAVERVHRAGFASCASGVRGCHVPSELPIPKGALCIRRDHCVASWPLAHTQYFLAQSSAAGRSTDSEWPACGPSGLAP